MTSGAGPRRRSALLEADGALGSSRRSVRWRVGGRRWRRAVNAASGGPVSAAPWDAAGCGVPLYAPGCPRLRPGCQPPGVAQRRAGGGSRSNGQQGMPVGAAIGFMAAQRLIRRRRWAARPPLPGCQAIACSWAGAAPHTPRRRRPLTTRRARAASRTPPPAVQGRRAGRDSRASPGVVVGDGPSPWPGVLARQNRSLGGPARQRWRSRWARRHARRQPAADLRHGSTASARPHG